MDSATIRAVRTAMIQAREASDMAAHDLHVRRCEISHNKPATARKLLNLGPCGGKYSTIKNQQTLAADILTMKGL